MQAQHRCDGLVGTPLFGARWKRCYKGIRRVKVRTKGSKEKKKKTTWLPLARGSQEKPPSLARPPMNKHPNVRPRLFGTASKVAELLLAAGRIHGLELRVASRPPRSIMFLDVLPVDFPYLAVRMSFHSRMGSAVLVQHALLNFAPPRSPFVQKEGSARLSCSRRQDLPAKLSTTSKPNLERSHICQSL